MASYLLVDLENVPNPKLPEPLPENAQVWVFAGHSQTKISLELAERLHALGPAARYIRLTGGGPNALDFHIACYLGRMSISEPDAEFTVISGDTGFDPLISHLNTLNVRVRRTSGEPEKKSIAKASEPPQADPAGQTPNKSAAAKKPAGVKTSTPPFTEEISAPPADEIETRGGVSQWELIERVLEKLEGMTESRPRSVKSFGNVVKGIAAGGTTAEIVEELLRIFEQRGVVINRAGKLTWDYSYSLIQAFQ
ncbi:MAG: PIN domain-containing protein [Planctomycetota bacterium]